MPEDNPYEELAQLWHEAREKFEPLLRFISAHSSSSVTASPKNKFWDFADSAWTWGAIGMLAGAAGQTISSAVFFVLAGMILSIQVWRSRPFERHGEFLSWITSIVITTFICIGLWVMWRIVPKPQKPLSSAEIENITKKNLPTAADIAAEVKKIMPVTSTVVAATPSASAGYIQKPEVSLIFKDSPLLTPERKQRITNDINGLYLYLKGLGFPIEKDIPPLGVSRSNAEMMGGTFPGPIYYRQILFPNDSLDDSDKIREVYASYVFRILFRSIGYPLSADPQNDMTAATVFEIYFPSSLVGRNLDKTKWQGHDWMQALWEIRSKKGKDFTDRAMYYTYKLWDPTPAGEFNKKFLTRFMAGVWVIDNNGESISAVGSILVKRDLAQK